MTDDPHNVSVSVAGATARFWLPDAETDRIQGLIATSRSFYESDLLKDAMGRLRPGDLVVDVGANIGNHTIFFSKICGARVIAFEPSARLFEILKRNVELNGVQDLVDLRNQAVGSEAMTGTLIPGPEANLGQTRVDKGTPGETPIVRLDQAVGQERVALLKIDVEGLDMDVLQGARGLIERDRPFVYIEAGPPDTLALTERFMLSFDYLVVERFAHTPTYLFADAADPRQWQTTAATRSTETIRLLRNLGDAVARNHHGVEVMDGTLRNGLTKTAQLLQNLDAKMTHSGQGIETLDGTLRNGLTELTDESRRQGEMIAVAKDEMANLRQLVESSSKAQSSAADAALSETIDRLMDLQQVYRGRADAYRHHLHILLSTTGWRVMVKAGNVARRLLGRGAFEPRLDEITAQVEKAYPFLQRKRTRPAAETSPLYPSAPSVEQVSAKTFAGIAAIPARAEALSHTIASLLPQVDTIGVYLNGWDEVPDFLRHERIVVARSQDHGDVGDAGKFHWVEEHDGYYFSCDDDLVYPKDYVQRLIDALRTRNNVAAVGWHGSLVKDPFFDYYHKDSRRVFTFKAHRPWDTPAHILGTGCTAFHTAVVRVSRTDFPAANMADVFFALVAQKQHIPLLIVRHDKDEVIEFEGSQETSIYGDSARNAESRKNTREQQTKLVGAHHWRTYEWMPLSVLVIGRFNGYKKGGIYKSCNLIADSLRSRGHRVNVLDTTEPLPAELPAADLAWIYPGDPNRPDFATVDTKIAALRAAGIPVLANLSHLYLADRSKWIASELKRYNADKSLPPVFAAVFAETVIDDPALAGVKDFVCYVPKTIEATPALYLPPFADRHGICFGDSTKLSNKVIIGGGVQPWIDAVSRRMPHVDLYAYKQYSGATPHRNLKIAPHMSDDFGDFLAARRLFVNLNVHLTFEMVPCEAQALGTPVIYRHMPHSLSEYIGPTGIRVRTPDELAEMAAWLYNDESAWIEFNRASKLNGEAIAMENANAALEASLRLCILRMRRIRAAS